MVSDHPQKTRIVDQGRRILVELEPKPTTSRCALLLPPVPTLLHDVALSLTVSVILVVVDEDGEVVGYPLTTIMDKKEAVDKFEPHPRLQTDAHISFPEAYVAHLHNRFHRGTYLELPIRGILVRTIPS